MPVLTAYQKIVLLEDAVERIRSKGTHTKGSLARDSRGQPVYEVPNNPIAVKFCAVGTCRETVTKFSPLMVCYPLQMERELISDLDATAHLLYPRGHFAGIVEFNDRHNTTQQQVVRVFHETIVRLRDKVVAESLKHVLSTERVQEEIAVPCLP